MMANRNPESSNPEQGDGGVTSTPPVLAADQQPSKPGNTVFKSGPLFISSKGIGWTSWKKRWFILTRTSLVFFRSDPNALPQKGSEANLTLGGIDLNSSGSVVVKADKKLLIVLFPDGRDGRTFTLKAETSEDLYEWKDALENALAQAPSGAAALDHTLAQTSGGSLLTGQSGGLLQDDAVDTIEGSFEQSTENQPVKSLAIERPILLTLEDDDGSPSFLEKALGFIEQYGVKAEGILRQAADVAEVERRIQEYEQGRNEFSPEEDAHVIADCVKHILRASPPIPASCCTSLLDAFKTTHGSRVNAMRATISETFPEPTRLLLKRILKMMQIVASHKSENLMSTPAVAACMAPLLLRPLMAGDFEVGDDFNMGGDSSLQLLQAAAAANHAQAIVITLMEEFRNKLFEDSSTESYSEGSGSEEGLLTGDEVSEDGDYDDEEDDIDIEIEDDYDAESDFHSETDDGDEENDIDLEEEDDPECNLSGSSGERSCNEGSGADNRKVSEGLDSDSHSPEVIKGSKDNDKPPTEIHTPPHWHHNSHSSSNLLCPSDNHSALPAIETRSSSVDIPASASPVLRSRNVSRSSSISKSTVKPNEPMPNVKRPAWGRAPGRKNLSMESIEFTTEDEVAIQKLESTKVDLQSHIEKEAKENRVLKESLERRKQDLHRRRLALEQDVTRLQEQLQKERELRATLESALTMPLGNLPISSTLDHKMKAEIEELALAETAVINLTQKAADLQVQFNQQRQDNHVSACQSCKALHQEKIKDEQKDIQTTAGEHHHESSPMHGDCTSLSNKNPLETDNENAVTQDPALSSKQHSRKKQIDSTSHNKMKAMGGTTNSQNVATQDSPSSSNKQPSTKLQTDKLSENNNKTNSTGEKTSSSADRVNKTFSKKHHSQKKQLGSKSHNKTKFMGKTASLSTDADNVATQDSPSLSDKQLSKKPQPDLVSENSMTISTGDTTSLLTDCEDAVMQNPALSSKQTSQKKQIDSTNKTKAIGTTPSLSTDSQNVATQDNSSLSNKQTPKKLQPYLESETSTKSTNAKSGSPPKEPPTVVRNTSSSKKTTGRVEGTASGPSTLTRLANRLNFLKERRNQIAHELQILRASSNPETKSDK